MSKTYTPKKVDDLRAIAEELLYLYGEKRIFTLQGPLGVGKTTFIKVLCKTLGVKDSMSSPSFAIANEYINSKGEPVYHLDLYRVEDEAEALDAGLEHYTDEQHYCFIEWPEVVQRLLPEDIVQIRMEFESSKARKITIH